MLIGCYLTVCGLLNTFAVPVPGAGSATAAASEDGAMIQIEQANLEVVAEFPKGYFLENLAVRPDGSVLVTVANKRELWCVPAPAERLPVKPVLVHRFDLVTLNMVEADPTCSTSPPPTCMRPGRRTCTGSTCATGSRGPPSSRSSCWSS